MNTCTALYSIFCICVSNAVFLVIGFTANSTVVVEGGNATICVRILEGIPYEDVTVNLMPLDVSATGKLLM